VDSTSYDLLEAFSAPHCAVCRLSEAAARAYLGGVLGDGVNDPKLRRDWRAHGGLCDRHWRALRALESPALPAALVTQDLLSHYLREGLPKTRRCRACEVARDAEGRYLRALRRLDEVRAAQALERGRGFVCLPHLGALSGVPLEGALRRKLEGLVEELGEFIRKRDYRFAGEPMGAERDSWLRAIRALGGEV